MHTSPPSFESRILRQLLRLAPYSTTVIRTRGGRALLALQRRGLIVMDAWGVVSLTHRGERIALNMA
jgi:hypothetical protein